MKKDTKTTLGVVIAVIIIAIIILTLPKPSADVEFAKCVGENSRLYVQTGCMHCDDQLDLFGENQKYLDVYNCMDDSWITCRALSIPGTPTWIIDDTKYVGKKSMSALKTLTGC